MSTMERWHAYWSDKQDPLWGPPEEDVFYQRYLHELEALLAGHDRRRVLEIGCGNGLLYRLLRFDPEGYLGLDYSQSMLDDFGRRHPEARLICADGSRYPGEGSYDLIISSGVLQYFSPAMVRSHLTVSAGSLAPGGLLLCALLPWRSLRWRYLYGDLFRTSRVGLLPMAVRWLRYRFQGDPLGHWFEPQELRRLAAPLGLEVEMLGSLTLPYRFHALLRRR